MAYDVTIAATQTFNNGQYAATDSRSGGESRHREQDRGVQGGADVQPLTNRRTKFVVLAFESSGWTDPTVQKVVNV